MVLCEKARITKKTLGVPDASKTGLAEIGPSERASDNPVVTSGSGNGGNGIDGNAIFNGVVTGLAVTLVVMVIALVILVTSKSRHHSAQ